MTIKQWQNIATWRNDHMTVEQLKKIINTLPDNTQVYIEDSGTGSCAFE